MKLDDRQYVQVNRAAISAVDQTSSAATISYWPIADDLPT
jgi:hypothetical protein